MTYQTAAEWCDNNVPKIFFDSFQEWFDACRDEFDNHLELFSHPEFISLMREKWESESDDIEHAKRQRQEIEQAIEDAEIELQLLADKADSDSVDDIRKVVKACYQYIATHRRI